VREIRTEIDLAAPAERVWQILTDFARYGEWNPVMPAISGEVRAGARLIVAITPAERRAVTFYPTVLAAEPPRELRWRGRLFVPGLFDGEHSFTIEPWSEQQIRFVQREVFRGLLVPLVARAMEGPTRRGFEAMNRALKARAER
jgi:hypothetical protein